MNSSDKNRGGRPRKAYPDLRAVPVTVRFKDIELQNIEIAALAAGLTASAYIRSRLATTEHSVSINPLALHDLAQIARELSDVGLSDIADKVAAVIALLR